MKKNKGRESWVKVDAEKHPKLHKALKWLENIWYHNMPAILCIVFFSAVTIFGFTQCMKKEQPDYKIMLCVDKYLPADVRSAMEIYLKTYGEDLNGDGEVIVHLMDCTSGSDRDQYQANMTTLLSELQMGEAVLIIADEHYYEYLTQNEDIFDTDECFTAKESKAYPLIDTDFGNFINTTVMEGYITEDVMLYKRIMDGTDSGSSEKAQQSKKDSVAFLRKFVKYQEKFKQTP